VSRQDGRWCATGVAYVPNTRRIKALTRTREREQQHMSEYMAGEMCLMQFLEREMDDRSGRRCGRCAVCVGQPLIDPTYDRDTAQRAHMYLLEIDRPIEPRGRWPEAAFSQYPWRGPIESSVRLEHGRVLCLWGDEGWGVRVRSGKAASSFDDELVHAVVTMLLDRWQPYPPPQWVTCVPSLRAPRLVSDFSQRVAQALGLPFKPCVRKLRPTEPQKAMQSGYRQAHNLDGAFAVDAWTGIEGPVLLIDDVVDSRWTFTVVGALLRQAGSGPVYPMALAASTPLGDV